MPDRVSLLLARPPLTLMELLYLCIGNWRRIAAAIIAGAIAGAAVGMSSPPRYESVAAMRIASSTSQPPAVLALLTVLQSNTLAEEIVHEMRLDTGTPPVTAITLRRDHLLVEQVRDTNIVRIHVVLPDATTAAAVANQIAVRAAQMYDAVREHPVAPTSESEIALLKERSDRAAAARGIAEQRFRAIESRIQPKTLSVAAGTSQTYQERLTDVRLRLQAERVRLRVLSEQWSTAGGAAANHGVTSEVLQSAVSMQQATVAALAAEEHEVAAQYEIRRLRDRLANAERDFEAAAASASAATTRYENAKAQLAATDLPAELFDRGVVPDRPLSRGLGAWVLGGLFAGLLTGIAWALARELLAPMPVSSTVS
jgi:uncharacterized protein involved in exopolysaccharide biosynthesis